MGEFLDQIPEKLRNHIREITRTSGLPDDEESVEKIANGWLEKDRAFVQKIQELDMEEVELLEKDDPRGVLALTYSGSLVNIGPVVNDVRNVQYMSIGLRNDVPDVAEREDSALAKDIFVDDTIEFSVGPVKHTSPILKIAVCQGELSADEQQEKISEATQIIEEEFIEVNKTIMLE